MLEISCSLLLLMAAAMKPFTPGTMEISCSMLLVLVFVLLMGKGRSFGKPRGAECVDSQLNSTLEYVSVLRYQSVGILKKGYACYMITQCSVDRLTKLAIQLKAWGGATSAAVYIPTKDHVQQMRSLRAIDLFMTKLHHDSQYGGWLTVSVMFGHEATPQLWNCTKPGSPGAPIYPINALRNLAVAATGGDPHLDAHHVPPYLLYLDADFIPSAGLSAWIDLEAQGPANNTFHQITQNGSVIVLPAFESAAAVPHAATRSLHYLLSGIKAGKIKQFHGERFSLGHGPTDYERWRKVSSSLDPRQMYVLEPYKVPFGFYYEPYIIIARQFFVPYDEHFRGYGLNKCVNIRWLHENGTTFHVLPGHFVVEDAHADSSSYNRYFAFRLFSKAAYYKAVAATKKGRMPAVSQNTAELLRAAGFGKVATEDPAAQEVYLRSVA